MFLSQPEEKKVRALLVQLKEDIDSQRASEGVEIQGSIFDEIADLFENLIATKPIVLDKDPSPNEAAGIVGISHNSVIEMVKAGRLMGYEIGGQWRVTRESLFEYLEKCTVEGG
jgi:excisionase family DNA binding protein